MDNLGAFRHIRLSETAFAGIAREQSYDEGYKSASYHGVDG